jgi:hypothetical protein
MRSAIILAAVLLLPAAPASAQQAEKDHAVATLLACAPATFDAAMTCLDRALTPENKARLVSSDAQDLRHGVGNFIRLGWGMYGDGPLSASLTALGVTEPDAKTELILDGYTAHLRGETFDLAKAAQSYRNRGAGQHSGDSQ